MPTHRVAVFEKCSFYKSAHEATKKFKLGITTHYTTAIESKASSTLKHKISKTEDKNQCRLSVQPSGKYSFWIKHPLTAIITTCLNVRLASRHTVTQIAQSQRPVRLTGAQRLDQTDQNRNTVTPIGYRLVSGHCVACRVSQKLKTTVSQRIVTKM